MAADPTYPVLDIAPEPLRPARPASGPGRDASRGRGWGRVLGRTLVLDLILGLCLLHGWGIWTGLGGREGLDNGWPIWRNDHPIYYHSALVTRSFLRSTGTTAGYDPAFMAGYPKSVIFPASSTLPELVFALAPTARPDLVYKLYVLVATAALPWLVALATLMLGGTAGAVVVAVALFLIYFWTGFPIQYAALGMVPYLAGIPLGLVATAAVARYAERGGLGRWLVAAAGSAACVLVHLTAAMVVVPAAAAAYLAGAVRARAAGGRFGRLRHLGVWLIPVVVLGLNAFWWWPGPPLAATKGASDFVLKHDEPVGDRLIKLMTTDWPIEGVLLGLGLFGLAASLARSTVSGLALSTFATSGFAWGYLAGFSRSLDFLQPGRHTYACYTGLAVAAGIGWSELARRLRPAGGRLDVWAAVGLVVVGLRLFGPIVDASVSGQLASPTTLLGRVAPRMAGAIPHGPLPQPFLSSRPSPLLLWVVERVKAHVAPGERLLYEEGGFAIPDDPEPFGGGRFSGLLPERAGVEVIGGPYLHAALTTNFTQFGEGKLFGRADWDRDRFVEYARIYRPAAIVCWSKRARAFCRANPDLIEIKDDEGRVLIGRVLGFEGSASRGGATVEAGPNRLVVTGIVPDVDGWAVLRYHSAPCLRSVPEGVWEPVRLGDDPVPFIRVRASDVPIELRLEIPRPWPLAETR